MVYLGNNLKFTHTVHLVNTQLLWNVVISK